MNSFTKLAIICIAFAFTDACSNTSARTNPLLGKWSAIDVAKEQPGHALYIEFKDGGVLLKKITPWSASPQDVLTFEYAFAGPDRLKLRKDGQTKLVSYSLHGDRLSIKYLDGSGVQGEFLNAH